jgi:hypothetical protein
MKVFLASLQTDNKIMAILSDYNIDCSGKTPKCKLNYLNKIIKKYTQLEQYEIAFFFQRMHDKVRTIYKVKPRTVFSKNKISFLWLVRSKSKLIYKFLRIFI